MRTFRHTITAMLALLFASTCFAQVTQFHQIGATSTQIVVAWDYSPASADCTVAAARDAGQGLGGSSPFTPLAFDVDASKFAHANDQQARYPSLQIGGYRVFVIGTPTVPSDPYPSLASNGLNYSRALQEESLYNVQVTCGASSAAIQAQTAQLPPGITYHYPFAISSVPGEYAYPTPPFSMGSTIIDPSTGIPLTELSIPGVQEQQKTGAFSANGACTNWANPQFMWNGAGAASYSASSNDPCTLTFGGSAAGIGGSGLSLNYGVPSTATSAATFDWDGYQVCVTGYASQAGENLDVQFTLNGGANLLGNAVKFPLPNGVSATICEPGGQSTPSGANITPIDTTFVPWQYQYGSTLGTSSSGGGTGILFNRDLGVTVWKDSTDASTIHISDVEMTLYYSKPFESWDGGENIQCSSQFVKDSAGLNGNLCFMLTEGQLYYNFWVSDQTSPPTVRFAGDALAPNPLETMNTGAIFTNGIQEGGNAPYSDVTPTDFYALGVDNASKLHILECVAPASGSSWWTGLYPNGSNTSLSASPASHGCPATSETVNDWSDLGVLFDPASAADSMIDQFVQDFPGSGSIPSGCSYIPTNNFPCFRGTQGDNSAILFPCATSGGCSIYIQNAQSHFVLLTARSAEQNSIAWYIAVDVSTTPATIAGVTTTYTNLANRWNVDHTPHQTGPTTWASEAGETTISEYDSGDGAGPYAFTLSAGITNSQNYICVDTDLPSEHESGKQAGGNFNELSYIQSGDVIQDTATSEQMWVTANPASPGGSCATGQYQVSVSRGVNGTAAQADANSGPSIFYMVPSQSAYTAAAKMFWSFANAPYGDIAGTDPSDLFMGGYEPYPASPACSPFHPCYAGNYIGSHDSYYNGYYIGEADNPNACINLAHPGGNCSTLFWLNKPAPFAGNQGQSGTNPDFGGITGSYEPHPAAAQGLQQPANAVTPAVDEDILNANTPVTCSNPTLVTGSLYSCSPSPYDPNYYGAAVMYFGSGIYPYTDVSGPASVIGSGSSANYEFCFVHVASECQPGSVVGKLYFNDPYSGAIDACSFSGSGAAQDFGYYGVSSSSNYQVCGGQLPQNEDGVQETAMLGQSTVLGAFYRVLTDAMNPFGRYNGLATAHTFGANNDVIFDSIDGGTFQGVRNPREDLWLAQVPSWKPVSTPQYDFVWTPVTMPAPPSSFGVASAEIDFGYDANLHCTPRQEVCVAYHTAQPAAYASCTLSFVNASCPFAFAQTDAYTRPPCASGCTILVPVIPDRVAYYVIKFYNSSGTLVNESAVKPAAPL